MNKCKTSAGLAVLLVSALGGNAFADTANNAHLEGMLSASWQTASESSVGSQKVEDEGNAQLYLYGSMDMGPGSWNMEVRGSTTPRSNGVSSFYGSNALVGETTDENGDGRLAVTQLFYQLPAGNGDLSVGLLDPAGFFDGSNVANDEYTQFLADVFVNNPTIAAPSFALGAGYQASVSDTLGYQVFAGSDAGLEDGDHSYHGVFTVDGKRDGYRKGAFTSAELDWQNAKGQVLKAGIWYDSGDVAEIGSTTGSSNGYGIYALAEAPLGSGTLQGRAGIANEDAVAAANFLSVAYQLPIKLRNSRDTTLGVALARTGASSNLATDDPIYQAEAYWRIHVMNGLYVAPDLQYIVNAGFDSQTDNVLVAGVRAGVSF